MLWDTRERFGLISILLHWAAAAAMIYLWFTGEAMEWAAESGGSAAAARATHIATGGGLAILLIGRVVWRALVTTPEHLGTSRPLNIVASAVKGLLMLVILVAVITGFLHEWSDGRAVDVFGLFAIPSPIGENHGLHRLSGGLHNLSSNVFLLLLGLHVLGALKHLIWDRDGTFGRMLWPKE